MNNVTVDVKDGADSPNIVGTKTTPEKRLSLIKST